MNPSIQKPKYEYQIQISQKDPYPFNGLKPKKFNNSVKLTLPFSILSKNKDIVHKMSKIDNGNMIKMVKVIQSYLRQTYTIIYEYVPYPIGYQSHEKDQYIKSGKYKIDLLKIFQEILFNGIRPVIREQNFGFSEDFKIKMYIRHDWQNFVINNQNEVQMLAAGYVNQCQKLFEYVQPCQKLKIKVTGLSQKLKKIQKQISQSKEYRKKQTKICSQGRNSSDNSDSAAKTGKNQKIGNAKWIFDPAFHFQDSYSVQDSKKKRRSSSFKFIQKPKSQNKQKKASWEASGKQQVKQQQKSSKVQSDKITVLKKRITEALSKTQKTLTKYEKIRNRTSKKSSQTLLAVPKLQ